MRYFPKTLLLIPIVIVGLLSTTTAAIKLEFDEQLTSFQIDDREPRGQQSVGDVLTLESVLINSTTGIQGKKNSTCKTIDQRNNGDLIISCNETITLPDGVIYTQGEINATRFDQFFKPDKLDIVGGEGAYQDARGKEKVTRIAFDKYTAEFVIH